MYTWKSLSFFSYVPEITRTFRKSFKESIFSNLTKTTWLLHREHFADQYSKGLVSTIYSVLAKT